MDAVKVHPVAFVEQRGRVGAVEDLEPAALLGRPPPPSDGDVHVWPPVVPQPPRSLGLGVEFEHVRC